MITVYFDIEQRTEEWHRMRWGKISGTRSECLLSGKDILPELVAEHTEPFQLDDEPFISADMQRGIELEPEAFKQLCQYIGIDLKVAGWIQNNNNELLGISPDAISADYSIMAEIKCPARKKHTRTIMEDRIPDDNLDQCIHAFTVNPHLKIIYFCSFRPESVKPLFVKPLTLKSMVNIGTKSKPIMRTIEEVAIIARNEADRLNKMLEEKINLLKF